MIYKTINLNEYYPMLKTNAKLRCYCIDNFEEFSLNRKRKSVLVLPGGGYGMVSAREGEPVALKFLGEDICAFCLEYSLGPYTYPYPIIEGFAALNYIRTHHEKLHIDPDHISLCGFSAGGHFAATLAAYQAKQDYADFLKVDLTTLKVNGLILCYPVITMDTPTHGGTRDRLIKNNPELKDYYSIEKHVSKDFPVTFIWTTNDDKCVNTWNTLDLAIALKKCDVRFELHYYPIGDHGSSLANEIVNEKSDYLTNTLSYFSSWIDLAIKFIKKIV